MLQGHLFVWRARTDLEHELNIHRCEFCNGSIKVDVIEEQNDVDGKKRWVSRNCNLCGWGGASFRNWDSGFGMITDPPWNSVKELKSFDISSRDIALDELGTHLSRNFSDIYSLDPFRFEQLIADVFSEHGKDAVVTTKTKDGGVDVFLIDRNTNMIDTIIEVKRYAAHRKVGIAPVERLAGVSLKWNVSKAVFVTCSGYTEPAKESATRITNSGIVKMDLVAAGELAKLLGIYNQQLPPLHLITRDIRAEIESSNRNAK